MATTASKNLGQLSQYEINMQVAATLEKIAFELSRNKSQQVSNLSEQHSTVATIGDVSKLYKISNYGYDPVIGDDCIIKVSDQFTSDLPASSAVVVALNEHCEKSSVGDIFKMTYDYNNGVIVTCFICEVTTVKNKKEYKDLMMLYYKGKYNIKTKAIEDTKLWVLAKNDQDYEIAKPLWPYIFSAKTCLFPIENLGKEQGVYGPYTVSQGQWTMPEENSLCAFIYKALNESLSANKIQNFTPDQIRQLWSNLRLGDPDIDFVKVFSKTLLTGHTSFLPISFQG